MAAQSKVEFPSVEGSNGWAVARHGPVILLTFKGRMGGTDGMDSARRFFELAGEDGVWIVADFLELRHYESRVRTDWQDIAFVRRHQMKSLDVGATNVFVRMGVQAFGLFVRMPTTVHKSRAELDRHLARVLALR